MTRSTGGGGLQETTSRGAPGGKGTTYIWTDIFKIIEGGGKKTKGGRGGGELARRAQWDVNGTVKKRHPRLCHCLRGKKMKDSSEGRGAVLGGQSGHCRRLPQEKKKKPTISRGQTRISPGEPRSSLRILRRGHKRTQKRASFGLLAEVKRKKKGPTLSCKALPLKGERKVRKMGRGGKENT